ncbi:hypothetical protein MHH37_06725 [Solibacillus sp. FSL K6-1781]|uniref:hypothetical protein n=1 Tax=Solibacillus sp. FSL K6-1781 TaxID=2921474 RepID=UPI003159DA35
MHKEFMGLSDDIHRYIVLELFLKTLERDRDHISHLKMKDVVEEWYNSKINETFQEFKKLRDFLYKKGCKIDKQKSDEMMTYYFILFRGYDETRSYSNIALRNWVSEEMKRLLGMKYLTPADRQ